MAFASYCTTGIAANLLGRRFLGIDKEEYLILSQKRKQEIEQPFPYSPCLGYRIYSYIFIVPLKSIPRASQRREYMQTNINISFGRKYLLVKRVDRFYGLSIRITGDCPEGGNHCCSYYYIFRTQRMA